MTLEVTVACESGVQRRQLLDNMGPISIGRHQAATIQLESEQVSRQHALVWVTPPMLRVQDESRNGTLAGERLLLRQTAEVPLDTPIVVASFALWFRTLSDAVTSTAEVAEPGALEAIAAVEPNSATFAPLKNASGLEPKHGVNSADQDSAAILLRREIHKALLEHLDLATIDPSKLDEAALRPKVISALRRIISRLADRLPPNTDQDELIGELTDEAVGLGPLEQLLTDQHVSEIMVVDPTTIFVEQNGVLTLSKARFTDDERVQNVIERIVTPLGRRIDESSPLVDARLKDGSRVNAVIRPIALKGSCITIRKFARTPIDMPRLIELGTLDQRMALFLERAVKCRKNIVVSGGTGSGKTTLLNVLSAFIPPNERIVTVEDAAELQLRQPHIVSLETRPANLEGRGEYTIRDLVRNALRMRPDRIVVGECRGAEALDMLQAMNTGHDGSLTTTHANSPREAVARLETLVLMAGLDLPVRAVREQIATSVNLIVQQSRLSDGTRKITSIAELSGIDDDGQIELSTIFEYCRTGTTATGSVAGEFDATGRLPSFLGELIVRGLIKPGENYL